VCYYSEFEPTALGRESRECRRNRSSGLLPFTLGDFFAVWQQPLDKRRAASARPEKKESMRVWVNGQPYADDPAKIPLTAHADIVIQVGPPFTKPAPYTTWGRL
jgi:hypothetical protein